MRIRVRHLALGALVAASAAFAAPTASDVTEQDVAASNAKVVMAYNALVAMWGDDFAQRGVRFAPARRSCAIAARCAPRAAS